MNRPSRNDDTEDHPEWNQSPNALSGDLTTRQDLNGIANLRQQTDHLPPDRNLDDPNARHDGEPLATEDNVQDGDMPSADILRKENIVERKTHRSYFPARPRSEGSDCSRQDLLSSGVRSFTDATTKFAKFIGPGFMVAVAYIDPGNYATDVAAGAATRFQLLFVVLMSNIFAIVLQSLAIRLGTVTGKNLAEHCRAHLPRWLNYTLYVFAETAVVATDVAEVIGSAIAINLLIPAIPLVAACAITLIDVLIILLFYKPEGGLRKMRPFEWFVIALVFAVVVCFCIELSLLKDVSVGEVFRGYLPSSTVINGQGLYLSCGILGATVMPHSLFLGSGIVQPRLKRYDEKHGNYTPEEVHSATDGISDYRPTLNAIKYCLRSSTLELALSLCLFAFFVNSAILIVAGASLSGNGSAQEADLFGIYHLLSTTIAPAAGILFAVALLFSGMSAGIVCTIAGQMISEGQIRWVFKPWLRRLITRGIAIIPAIVIAAGVGRAGLSNALTASQVILSVVLPFVSAPLLYFTCFNKFMTVHASERGRAGQDGHQSVGMRNHLVLSTVAILIWLLITIMNASLIIFLILGKT